MKAAYPYLRASFLSIALLAGIEYLIVVLTNDYKNCFFHNSVPGNILLWLIRIPLFLVFASFFYNLFLPKYVSLKDRMMQREEELRELKKAPAAPSYRFERLNGEVKPA